MAFESTVICCLSSCPKYVRFILWHSGVPISGHVISRCCSSKLDPFIEKWTELFFGVSATNYTWQKLTQSHKTGLSQSTSMFSIRNLKKNKRRGIVKSCLFVKGAQQQLNLLRMIFKRERSICVGGRNGKLGIMQPMRNKFTTGSSQSLTQTSLGILNPQRKKRRGGIKPIFSMSSFLTTMMVILLM